MKITGFLVLSFLLLALSATSFPDAVHAKDPAAVLDVFGNELTAGASYFIGAASNDFAVTATSPIICNSDVLLSPMSNGLPVTFSPVVTSDNSVIHEDSYLNVDFVAPTCRMAGVTTMWKMEFRAIVRGFAVTTGGGVDRLNLFKITKYGGDNSLYQLSYCPVSDPFCECSCVPVGNVVNRLVPNAKNPLPVVTAGARYFIRATSDEDNTTTLAVSATSRIICNSDVTLSPMSDKLPITFSPVEESDDSVIREGAYLNVNFNASSCRMAGVTTMWKIELRPTMRGFVVTTGGVDRLNLFKITKYGGDNSLYQLSYCQSRPFCECSCVPVGNVVNRLVPNAKNPLPVDTENGGISDRPENAVDVFHTYFGVAGKGKDMIIKFHNLETAKELTQGKSQTARPNSTG
uniref:Uncharacterized protein n=1 Tax=Salix viminalis TaxID=40686 RepID=A0A6N2KLG9_SALVM